MSDTGQTGFTKLESTEDVPETLISSREPPRQENAVMRRRRAYNERMQHAIDENESYLPPGANRSYDGKYTPLRKERFRIVSEQGYKYWARFPVSEVPYGKNVADIINRSIEIMLEAGMRKELGERLVKVYYDYFTDILYDDERAICEHIRVVFDSEAAGNLHTISKVICTKNEVEAAAYELITFVCNTKFGVDIEFDNGEWIINGRTVRSDADDGNNPFDTRRRNYLRGDSYMNQRDCDVRFADDAFSDSGMGGYARAMDRGDYGYSRRRRRDDDYDRYDRYGRPMDDYDDYGYDDRYDRRGYGRGDSLADMSDRQINALRHALDDEMRYRDDYRDDRRGYRDDGFDEFVGGYRRERRGSGVRFDASESNVDEVDRIYRKRNGRTDEDIANIVTDQINHSTSGGALSSSTIAREKFVRNAHQRPIVEVQMDDDRPTNTSNDRYNRDNRGVQMNYNRNNDRHAETQAQRTQNKPAEVQLSAEDISTVKEKYKYYNAATVENYDLSNFKSNNEIGFSAAAICKNCAGVSTDVVVSTCTVNHPVPSLEGAVAVLRSTNPQLFKKGTQHNVVTMTYKQSDVIYCPLEDVRPVIDQIENIWSDDGISLDDRESIIRAARASIDILGRNGKESVYREMERYLVGKFNEAAQVVTSQVHRQYQDGRIKVSNLGITALEDLSLLFDAATKHYPNCERILVGHIVATQECWLRIVADTLVHVFYNNFRKTGGAGSSYLDPKVRDQRITMLNDTRVPFNYDDKAARQFIGVELKDEDIEGVVAELSKVTVLISHQKAILDDFKDDITIYNFGTPAPDSEFHQAMGVMGVLINGNLQVQDTHEPKYTVLFGAKLNNSAYVHRPVAIGMGAIAISDTKLARIDDPNGDPEVVKLRNSFIVIKRNAFIL